MAASISRLAQVHSKPLNTAMNATEPSSCVESDVLILGAGAAGIGAAKVLHQHGISSFTILECNDQIGGRLHNTPLGRRPDGSQYKVELGGNWITGLISDDGIENPVWALAKEHGLHTVEQDDSLTVYDQNGEKDIQPQDDPLWKRFDKVQGQVSQLADELLESGSQDRTVQSALRQLGWHSANSTYAQDLELVGWEWDSASDIRRIGLTREVGGGRHRPQDPQFDDRNNLVLDPRGYSYLFKAEAAKFLQPQDARLQFNTIVSHVEYSDEGVQARTQDGRCFKAKYAICTFSVGVLQNSLSPSAAPVSFSPEFPEWKRASIGAPDHGIYTKLFLQFPPDKQFWPDDKSLMMYVHPTIRGRYTIWQNWSRDRFLPGSGIILATVLDVESHRVENQPEDVTKGELLDTLRQMFPGKDVPAPLDFKFMHWGQTPWSFGSYSSTPADATDEQMDDLKKPLGRLHFAGEYTSSSWQGYVHGAYTEGMERAELVAQLLAMGG